MREKWREWFIDSICLPSCGIVGQLNMYWHYMYVWSLIGSSHHKDRGFLFPQPASHIQLAAAERAGYRGIATQPQLLLAAHGRWYAFFGNRTLEPILREITIFSKNNRRHRQYIDADIGPRPNSAVLWSHALILSSSHSHMGMEWACHVAIGNKFQLATSTWHAMNCHEPWHQSTYVKSRSQSCCWDFSTSLSPAEEEFDSHIPRENKGHWPCEMTRYISTQLSMTSDLYTMILAKFCYFEAHDIGNSHSAS